MVRTGTGFSMLFTLLMVSRASRAVARAMPKKMRSVIPKKLKYYKNLLTPPRHETCPGAEAM